MHRIRFADLDGDRRDELIVVPLFGRDTTPPNFAEAPVRILAYKIPADPVRDRWTPQVLNEELHVAHNFWPTDLDQDGKLDILVASFEGVSLLRRQADGRWARTLVGAGNQATAPSRGASEVKHGRLRSGADYIATIEPWHGFQVIVYTRPPGAAGKQIPAGSDGPLWPRQVVDEQLKWGHAVWCAILTVTETRSWWSACAIRRTAKIPAGCAFTIRPTPRVRTGRANSWIPRAWRSRIWPLMI